MNSANKSIFAVLAILAVAVAGFMLLYGGGSDPVVQPVVDAPTVDQEPAASDILDEPIQPAVREEEVEAPARTEDTGNSGADNAQGIRGRIIDLNNLPVANADIYLVESIQANAALFFDKWQSGQRFTPVASTFSKEDGTFELGVARLGQTYELRILSKDHADGVVPNVKILAEDWYDAGDIRLGFGIPLRGNVTSGMTGGALEGATITLAAGDGMDRMYSIPGRESGRTATTDAKGFYEFAHIKPGYYSLEAVAEGHAQLLKSRQNLEQGREHEINLELAAGLRLAGTVVDPEGQPVEGADVTVTSMSAKAVYNKSTRTDTAGRFEFIGVSDAPYKIRVKAGQYQPREVKPILGGNEDVRIPLETKAAVRIQVTDANGRAVTRYRMLVLRTFEKGNQLGKVPGMRPVNVNNRKIKNGEFVFQGLDQGKFIAQITPLKNGPKFAKAFSAPFNITGGEEKPLVKIKVSEGAKIIGQVVDANGAPVAGATVQSNLSGIMEDIPVFGALAAAQPKRITKSKAKTDGNGMFSMGQMSAGNYQFTITHSNFCTEVITGVAIPAEGETDIGVTQLAVGCILSGVATLNGQPQGQLKVVISEPTNDQQTRQPVNRNQPPSRRFFAHAISDNQGNFRIAKRIPPGVYEIFAQRTNLQSPFLGIVDRQNSIATVQIGFQAEMQRNINIRVDQ